jgi:GT2 family glycosyltransferase
MLMQKAKEGLKKSIVVVTYNGIQHFTKCLDSIVKNTSDFELIVVDNASTDGTVGMLRDLIKTSEPRMTSAEKFGEAVMNGKSFPMKIIFNKENKNFGPGNNQGVAIAEGERIILLNSDTIVTPYWTESLERCLTHQEGIAMVGPVTSNSNGRQQVPSLGVDDNLPTNALKWMEINENKYMEAGLLYGWCMYVRREFLEKEEYVFDERFTNSYEDNDLCLRARLKGWKLFIDGECYIHHFGQSSFKTAWGNEFFKKYMANGYKNRALYFDKWKPKENQKLIAVYRIANCEQYVAKSLEQASKFADEIICLFARSQDKTKEIALSFPKVTVWEEWSEPEHPFDEQAERNWLLQQAIARGADWVISIDGDEVYEDKFVENARKYMMNPNPEVLGYWLNWRTIWDTDTDGREMFRADGIFGGFQNYRFFKVLPGMEIKRNDNIYNHHCGSAPSIPQENLRWINARVKHLGYDSDAQRRRKHAFYKKNDPRPLAKDVGNSDYHHLVDTNVVLKPYKEKNRLSIMTICKNEEDLISSMLWNVEPIADEFVIVDTGSTDGTLDVVRQFARETIKEVRIIDASKMFERDEDGMILNYSEAKNFGKSQCRYEWVLNMDCDEMFAPEEVTGLFGLIDEDIDAYLVRVCNYLEMPRGPKPEENTYAMSETIRLYRNIDELFYAGLVHESLEEASTARARSGKGSIVLCPLVLHHRGYLKDKSKMRAKVDRYYRINKKQFEVSGEQDPRPLFNMALHLANDGDMEGCEALYKKCLELQPDFWRAKQNLAILRLNESKKLFNEAFAELPDAFKKGTRIQEVVDFLNARNFDTKKVA